MSGFFPIHAAYNALLAVLLVSLLQLLVISANVLQFLIHAGVDFNDLSSVSSTLGELVSLFDKL